MAYSIIYELIRDLEQIYRITGFSFNAQGFVFSASIALAIELALYFTLYAFRGIAISKMAKRKGLKNTWLAFVPCACYYLLGNLQDETLPSAKRNVIWTYVAVISSSVLLVCGVLLEVFGTIPTLKNVFADFNNAEKAITSEHLVVSRAIDVIMIVYGLIGLILSLSLIIVYMNVYRAYDPRRATTYSIIGVVADVFLGTGLLYAIFLFVMRNNERTSFSQYVSEMRARTYGGNYNPYGRYDNGHNANPRRENKSEDPFAEFSQSDESPFTDSEGNSFGGNDKDDNSDDLF